jgi:hypothetical protein
LAVVDNEVVIFSFLAVILAVIIVSVSVVVNNRFVRIMVVITAIFTVAPLALAFCVQSLLDITSPLQVILSLPIFAIIMLFVLV